MKIFKAHFASEPWSNCKRAFFIGLTAILFVAIPLSTFASIATDDGVEVSGTTMGPIIYSVVITDAENTESKEIGAGVQSVLDRVNDSMSTYKSDSYVSRFNDSESTDWFTVDAKTAAVVKRSLEISEMTEGAFDITVGPAVNLWKFGPKKNDVKLPSREQIEALHSYVGYQLLSVRTEPPGIKKSNAKVQIDLSAIAKGYAVDEVASYLRSRGYENYMIEVGGEVFAVGKSPKGRAWRIGIEKPVRLGRQIDNVVEIENVGLATSGDYRNFRLINGKRYSHTIDPVTCRPVVHYLATASVCASDCMSADAFATAVMVMGKEKGIAFSKANDLELYLIERAQADPTNSELYDRHVSESYPLANKAAKIDAGEGSSTKSDDVSGPKKSILPVFLAAMIVFSLAILGMAIGSITGNKSIKGSCGGLASMSGETDVVCTMCDSPTSDCVEQE